MRSLALNSLVVTGTLHFWITLLGLSQTAHAQGELTLSNAKIVFATKDQAADFLSKSDTFVEQLSAFDRSARLKTDQPVDQAHYLKFVSEQALDWTEAEQSGITNTVVALQAKLASFKLNLPGEIWLIKTTGLEEGNAAYTRGPAIVLPKQKVAGVQRGMESLLVHELFHVLSRHDQTLREKLYATIGFHPCTPLELPSDLSVRMLTNPDGPTHDHYINVEHAGQAVAAIPILFSQSAHYDPKRGGEFFNYMTFKLMAIEPPRNGQPTRPLLKENQPLLLDPKSTPGYMSQIGSNTGYIIHPDEVLADNFVLLVNGRQNVSTPELLDKLRDCFLNQ